MKLHHRLSILLTVLALSACSPKADEPTGDTITGGGNPAGTARLSAYTLASNIRASQDDAEQRADGAMNFDSSDIELIRDADRGDQLIGLRFSVAIPKGAVIDSARIQFTVDETSDTGSALLISLEDSANAPQFSNNRNDLSERAYLSSTIAWSPPAWLAIDDVTESQLSPNMAPMFQNIINKNEWQPCQYVHVSISGSGDRVAVSFDKDAAKSAKLLIEYRSAQAVSSCGANGGTDGADNGESDQTGDSGGGTGGDTGNNGGGIIYPPVQDGSVVVNPQPSDVSGGDGDDTALITWLMPSRLESGATISASDIQEYRIYHSMAAGNFTLLVQGLDVQTLHYTAAALLPGTHYFVLKVVDKNGRESVMSNMVSKTIAQSAVQEAP